MQKTLDLIRAFAREEDGVTAIEYGLLAALVAVGIIAGATTLGKGLNSLFTSIGGVMSTAATTASGS
jgi:pilus assembly protein Flp/PilA